MTMPVPEWSVRRSTMMVDPSLPYTREGCTDPTHAPCDCCSGEILVGAYDPITVPKLDEAGFPTLGEGGRLVTIQLFLPRHVPRVMHSPFRPVGEFGHDHYFSGEQTGDPTLLYCRCGMTRKRIRLAKARNGEIYVVPDGMEPEA